MPGTAGILAGRFMSSRPPLKGLVDFTDRFSHLPPLLVITFLLPVVVLVAKAWDDTWAAVAFGALALGDLAMLATLPRFGRSYGPFQLPWLSLTALRLVFGLGMALVPRAWGWTIAGLGQFGLSLAAVYACWIEPARLGMTRVTVHSARMKGCPPLRVLHVSDLHVERVTARERCLIRLVRDAAPDVIVVTGDYLNISYTHDVAAQRQTRALLRQLQAPGGVYAITGSPSVDPVHVVAELLDGLEVCWLRDQIASLTWKGYRLQIAGIECSADVEADEQKLRLLLDGRSSDAFTLLLCHTPDVMPTAAEVGVDLFLAGHTHGGQLRLPFFGAVVTASAHGKRYEMGAYREAQTLLYVSRGVGMEGKGAPRARFLCPPEVVLFTITGPDA